MTFIFNKFASLKSLLVNTSSCQTHQSDFIEKFSPKKAHAAEIMGEWNWVEPIVQGATNNRVMKFFLISNPTCNQEQPIIDYLASYVGGVNTFKTVLAPSICSDSFYESLVQSLSPEKSAKVEELDGTLIFCPPDVTDNDSRRRAYVEGAILESVFDSTFSSTKNNKLVVAPSNAIKYIIGRVMKMPINKYHLLDIKPGSLSVFTVDRHGDAKVSTIGSMKHLNVNAD